MSLSHEHVGLKILAKIKIYILSRAKLLITVWDEIPCSSNMLYVILLKGVATKNFAEKTRQITEVKILNLLVPHLVQFFKRKVFLTRSVFTSFSCDCQAFFVNKTGFISSIKWKIQLNKYETYYMTTNCL